MAKRAGQALRDFFMNSLEDRLKSQARQLGFDNVGIAAAVEADGFADLRAWLDNGHAGTMSYMEKHADARRHPTSILPSVRSVIMTATNYNPSLNPKSEIRNPNQGQVARYARGQRDYHDVLWERLGELLAWLQTEVPGCRGRAVVDTAPLLERDFARRAGLGWFGKNTMLIDKHLGSYFFLGALLVDIELTPDAPHSGSHCGTCTACLDACPTQAFPKPHVLDARKCISYLTIELKGPIPVELRPDVGDWLFGCDVCQEVCPWNRKAPLTQIADFQPGPDLDPISILSMTEEEFRHRFKHSALWRTRRRGLVRNTCIVLGNVGDQSALSPLENLLHDSEPVITEAASWAISRINERLNTI